MPSQTASFHKFLSSSISDLLVAAAAAAAADDDDDDGRLMNDENERERER